MRSGQTQDKAQELKFLKKKQPVNKTPTYFEDSVQKR